MSDLFRFHLQRLKAGADQATSIQETSKWIAQNTYINGKPYSYKNHEFQERILNSTAREINVRKCSQVGMSEVSIRRHIALCGMIKNFTTIYTLPTASFAATLSKTRINPVLSESPYLKQMVGETDNVEVKRLGTSYLYIRGASSTNAPISIPCDALCHDELDFSDPLVISQYQSRLTHSQWKLKFRLSTPTLPGRGIDFEFQRSRRYYNFCRCAHCSHMFIPDYYENVRIPEYTGDLRDINKLNLHKLRYTEAHVVCPKCGLAVDLGPDNREWVCENPDDSHIGDGFQVTPFDAPLIVTPGDLVQASTQYQSVADFVNFSLGLPFASSEAALDPREIEACITREEWVGSSATVCGIDVGKTCHLVVARCSFDGSMQIVHLEKIPFQRLRDRYIEIRQKYRIRTTCIDSLPYTDLVLALQAIDMNLHAVVYTQFRGTELYQVRSRDADAEKGLQQLRQINVHRDRTFDSLMAFIRSGQFSKMTCENDAEFVRHCTDMRRIKDWSTKTQQIEFRWVKSAEGDDHFFFAFSYAYLAKLIIGTFQGSCSAIPLLSSFRLKPALA